MMAYSPRYYDRITPEGVTRVPIVYTRLFQQTVRLQFCWLHAAGVDHSCAEERCWE